MTRSHAGRPAHVPTDENRNMVESLSGFGIPQDEIARLVGIDPKTLRFHYPRLTGSSDNLQTWPARVSTSAIPKELEVSIRRANVDCAARRT